MPPSARGTSVCLSCRLRLLARLYTCGPALRPLPSFISHPSLVTSLPSAVSLPGKGHVRGLHSRRSLREQHTMLSGGERENISAEKDTGWTPHLAQWTATERLEEPVKPGEKEEVESGISQAEDQEQLFVPRGSPEEMARAARQTFGDRLPKGVLNRAEYKMYERLYGTPLPEIAAEEELDVETAEEEPKEVLLREGEDGELEEVEYFDDGEPLVEEQLDQLTLDEKAVGQDKVYNARSKADSRLEDDIHASMGAATSALTIRSPDEVAVYEEEGIDVEEVESDGDTSYVRTHPFTQAGRWGTNPSTLPLPLNGLIGPTSLLLADTPNKHLDESAARIFGGSALPYGTGTPLSSRVLPQKPIPLSAGQSRMTDMEADLYMATVMPGTYAAVMSVLVETRKRMGSQWIEGLMNKEGGPRVLDAGAGGAGVLAWREVMKAEWSRLNPEAGSRGSDEATTTPPFGKATVLTASAPLRQRASILLDNTTFIPRLPDYVHTHFDADAERKQFDIIIAPHSLWHLQEDYERRLRVLNLWSLLDPKGGILILLEKGVPRGFEVVADARGYLLGELFDGSTLLNEEASSEQTTEPAKEEGIETTDEQESKPQTLRASRRAPGRIIAPCTNHSKCPMYLVPGISRQRKDYCHFSQRYVRPHYLQRILGARDRNHEDVRFSYVAVQKGVAFDDSRDVERGNFGGDRATERAFMGYEVGDEDITPSSSTTTSPTPSHFPHPPPRLILPPLKRHGHILLDVCTPSGTLERWTVTKSTSRQAYRDARKAKWGDLWMLGAKFREGKRVRLGWGHMEQGIGTGKGSRGIREAAEMNAGKGSSGKRQGKGPVKDVSGRGREGGGREDMSEGTEKRNARRKEEKERGRLKARSRRRNETRELFGGGRGDE